MLYYKASPTLMHIPPAWSVWHLLIIVKGTFRSHWSAVSLIFKDLDSRFLGYSLTNQAQDILRICNLFSKSVFES